MQIIHICRTENLNYLMKFTQKESIASTNSLSTISLECLKSYKAVVEKRINLCVTLIYVNLLEIYKLVVIKTSTYYPIR